MAVRLQTLAVTSNPTTASAIGAIIPEMGLSLSVGVTTPFMVTFSTDSLGHSA